MAGSGPAEPEPGAGVQRRGNLFWSIWERAWWLVALGFVAVNAWAAYVYGWMRLVGFWASGFVCLGAALLLYGWHARRRALDSLTWLPVQARILSSRVVEVRQRSFSDDLGTPLDYVSDYYPEVEYEYEVQGRGYHSNRILLVRVNYPVEEARALVGRYQPGTVVRAWCDPRRPRMAVLEPGLGKHSGKYRIPMIVGAGFVVFGFGVRLVLHFLAR